MPIFLLLGWPLSFIWWIDATADNDKAIPSFVAALKAGEGYVPSVIMVIMCLIGLCCQHHGARIVM